MFNWFRLPSPERMAEVELVEAKRSLLKHQSLLEYNQAMVDFEAKRVARLEKANVLKHAESP